MAKRCPSCGYGPIGPFIDNCPICAEPVRNVRSFGGGSGGSGGVPWLRWVIIGAVVAVLGVGGCCGLGMWRMGQGFEEMQREMQRAQAQVEADRQARTVVVNAKQLLQEFQVDPAAADEKYQGKYLELTGVVERGDVGRRDRPFVVLYAGDESARTRIECFFNYASPAEEGRIRRLAKGQALTVRGEYDGRVTNVQLRECVLAR